MKTTFYYFLVLTFLLLANNLSAQTKVRGTVEDSSTGEPLPFVNIVFKGTTVGTITDVDGKFFIQAHINTDSLEFSMVGYTPHTEILKRNAYQEVHIKLEPDNLELDEIVVTPGENPAWRIMRNVAANRKRNNPEKLECYKYEVYNKMELDINNVKNDWSDKMFMKNFNFVFNYADTSAETGKVYLPVMITETISDVYHKSNPSKKKEVIKASKISGVENASVAQYTGQMYLDVNIYKNYIPAFGHDFVSPLSDYWKANYKFYLLDSVYQDGSYLYHLSFKPKFKQTYTFSGDMWINDTTWAVKKVTAKMANDVNINYINNMIISQEYEKFDSIWFLKKEEMFMDFNLTDSTMGFFGKKTMTRKNIEINPVFEEKVFNATATEETIIEDGANERDSSYWNMSRHEKLTQKELNIYEMVDSIKEVPVFKTITNSVEMFINGYWIHGNFEYGPYYKILSHNAIEGWRVRLGGRTSNKFSKKLMLSAYGAYGFKDEKFKYGADLLYIFNKKPRRTIEAGYKYDMEQLGQSNNAFSEDNILSSMLSKHPNRHLLPVREAYTNYSLEYFLGFSNDFGVKFRQLYPTKFIVFKNNEKDITFDKISSLELYYKLHFCYNEKFVEGNFLRSSMGSDYPAFDITAMAGFWDNKGKTNTYYRFIATLTKKIAINPLGKLTCILEAGKVIGTVPFPLLKLHEGNETYAFDKYAFNLMNLYEFASDTYFSTTLEHHFNGFFFNRIPLLRKLKWREIIYAKGLIGDISEKNSRQYAIMDFPSSLSDVNRPYFEAGLGVENIFKFFRVDGVWRLSHLDNPGISKFAVLFKVQVIL